MGKVMTGRWSDSPPTPADNVNPSPDVGLLFTWEELWSSTDWMNADTGDVGDAGGICLSNSNSYKWMTWQSSQQILPIEYQLAISGTTSETIPFILSKAAQRPSYIATFPWAALKIKSQSIKSICSKGSGRPGFRIVNPYSSYWASITDKPRYSLTSARVDDPCQVLSTFDVARRHIGVVIKARCREFLIWAGATLLVR